MPIRLLRAALALALAGALLATGAAPAHACGGFFCNSQPIAQKGENILFSMEDDGSITAVVQIQYTGTATDFAWILPVPSVPTIGVGTDALFNTLGPQTSVLLARDYRTEGTCRGIPSSCGWWGDTAFDGPSAGGMRGIADAGAAADAGAPVEILARTSVGPYDTVTLTGTDVAAITTWLTDAGFRIPAGAADKLGIYVAKHSVFVALKLTKDAETGDIQPVTLHYVNGEPCIPIQLTAIATVDDMPITAYFVANHDMGPENFASTEIDFDQASLWNGTLSYGDAVSYAVDDAGGHAFVTDYEGAVPSVYGLELPAIEDLRTVTDPKVFLQNLLSRGYRGDSQLLAIFGRFLPPPAGVMGRDFYNCLGFSCPTYDAYLATLHFDPSGLVDALNTGIVTPRRDAQAMLSSHTRLTRLFTTMSAAEMTVDPTFVATPTREVSNVHTSTVVTLCSHDYFYFSAPQDLVLPSGRRTHLTDGIRYYGTDAEFCADYMSGAFSPWTPTDRLRATAATRAHVRAAGGGGLYCAVGPQTGGAAVLAPVVALGLALGAGVARRRRRG